MEGFDMKELLTEILSEMKAQTALLERLTKNVEARDQQTEVAKEAMRRAAGAFKGTPFEKLIDDAVGGGKFNGQ
jgi:hypothetical protein